MVTLPTAHTGGLVTVFLVLRAFASGCTALTGVEAVSNGIPSFRPPKDRNAAAILAIMGTLAVVMFGGITALGVLSRVHMVEGAQQKTALSQVGLAVFGSLEAEFEPSMDRGEFLLKFRSAPGSSMDETRGRLGAILQTLDGHDEVRYTYAAIGAGDADTVRDGLVYVKLVPRHEREMNARGVIAKARADLLAIPGVTLSILDNPDAFQKALVVILQGEDIVTLKKYAADLKAWRLAQPMDRFKALRKLYNDAGVTIYATKMLAPSMSDAEFEYVFDVAEALGATHTTLELPTDSAALKRIGDYAERRKIYAAYHTHLQGTLTAFDEAFAVSRGNMANVDFGHYVAAGSGDPPDAGPDATGDSGPSGPTIAELCTSECTLRVAFAASPVGDSGATACDAVVQNDCEDTCVAEFPFPDCPAWLAFKQCIVDANSWYCDSGDVYPEDGVCAAEQGAIGSCIPI